MFPHIIIIQVDVAQDLRGILLRIGRFKSLELYYSKVHLKSIKQLWEDLDSKQRANKLANDRIEAERLSSRNEFQSSSPSISFSSWLPTFYDDLLLYLEQEWKWYGSCFVQILSVILLITFQKGRNRLHIPWLDKFDGNITRSWSQLTAEASHGCE